MAEFGGGRGDNAGERAREEFFSEAQEVVDGLSRDLVLLDAVAKRGESDAELVNDIFRAVHTMKGLSGLFGAAMMSALSHELENLLDDLRLGRIELSSEVLDLLFRSVELYGKILASSRGDAPEPAAEVKDLLAALSHVSEQKAGAGGTLVAQYELDPGLLGVLTEYEEHRLRTNIQLGLSLYRMRVTFSLMTIDSALDDLKARTRPHGEILTYLPTGEGGDADTIELEILVASKASLDALRAAVGGPNVIVAEVERRGGGMAVPQPDVRQNRATGPAAAGPPAETGEFSAHVPSGAPPAGARSIPPTAFRTTPPSAGGMSLAPPPEEHARVSLSPHGIAAGADGKELSLRSVSQTVRVDIRKLDHLMNIVGELAIVRGTISKLTERVRSQLEMRELGTELHRLHRSFDRHLTQMQNGILEVRMVPLGQVFDKLARIVRQAAREHEKQANLVIAGADTEIDKLIVEELSDPLMHMIRNAIDHGIESRDERMRVGKPPVGTIALNAFQKGNHVVIEIEDDGRGMDQKRILAVAVKRKVVSEEEATQLSPKEILNLVFVPGFTTKDEATALSGRGVGMDVVKTNIGKLGGVVDISSELGIGTKMTITLPITLAIISVLMMKIGGQTFCMPLANVEEAIGLDESLVRVVEGREVMTQRGATLPIVRLAKFFRIDDDAVSQRAYVVIGTLGDRRVGFVVDRLLGQQDIVIKALGKSLKHVRGFAGATELGDQRVGLVLDVAALIEEVLHHDDNRVAGVFGARLA